MRYMILFMLFMVTTFNYADRAILSIAGTAMKSELGFDAVTMGFIFSAFSWAYVLGQLPGGWLLDRFGSKRVYAASIFIWSLFTLLQGGVHFLGVLWAVPALFMLRFMVGLAEAPSFPPMAASSPPGSPPPNVAPLRQFSIPPNISPPCCLRP
ncbi:sugar (and other) transporter family protein [Collimonas arenae]|nr:sugar (and other) transporter family protein [Collimonas arenae]